VPSSVRCLDYIREEVARRLDERQAEVVAYAVLRLQSLHIKYSSRMRQACGCMLCSRMNLYVSARRHMRRHVGRCGCTHVTEAWVRDLRFKKNIAALSLDPFDSGISPTLPWMFVRETKKQYWDRLCKPMPIPEPPLTLAEVAFNVPGTIIGTSAVVTEFRNGRKRNNFHQEIGGGWMW